MLAWKHIHHLPILLVLGMGLFGSGLTMERALAEDPFERPPIEYSTTPVNDRVALLQRQLDAGEAKLEFDPDHGYLPAVLRLLKTQVSSQVLVFSKTSLQRSKISPQTPRAVYFNDDTYIGFCQRGDVLELASVDARQGTVFYSLAQAQTERPRFERHTDNCLTCHATSRTLEVPGLLVRSVSPSVTGEPVYSAGTIDVHHDTPLAKRWGGWYVTGRHGEQRHMGNAWLKGSGEADELDSAAGANITDLSPWFDSRRYLSPHSDIVALMVLEHQARLHNLLTFANFDGRAALWYNAEINKSFKSNTNERLESTTRRINGAVESLLAYMLFTDEAPLAEPLVGTSAYTTEFAQLGPRDGKGRSLRDFDLQTRMFKYPCSYLIHGPQFAQLPDEVKSRFYERLHEVLTGRDTSPTFARLTPADRQAILEILRETQPNLPDFFAAK